MNKTAATKAMRNVARWGYFADGSMEAYMNCPECSDRVYGYLAKYAETYANGVTYKDAMVTHLMEEH